MGIRLDDGMLQAFVAEVAFALALIAEYGAGGADILRKFGHVLLRRPLDDEDIAQRVAAAAHCHVEGKRHSGSRRGGRLRGATRRSARRRRPPGPGRWPPG